jgi:hypothetical protein
MASGMRWENSTKRLAALALEGQMIRAVAPMRRFNKAKVDLPQPVGPTIVLRRWVPLRMRSTTLW